MATVTFKLTEEQLEVIKKRAAEMDLSIFKYCMYALGQQCGFEVPEEELRRKWVQGKKPTKVEQSETDKWVAGEGFIAHRQTDSKPGPKPKTVVPVSSKKAAPKPAPEPEPQEEKKRLPAKDPSGLW